ncbi:hypothetical protein LEP1GSC005_1941 [Leptospira santarosai str. ST188]|nr:hypothetical protein LEP1GSC005_1941 [Leptospira santarosai str. ST188]
MEREFDVRNSESVPELLRNQSRYAHTRENLIVKKFFQTVKKNLKRRNL